MLNVKLQKNYKNIWFFFIAITITNGATCAKSTKTSSSDDKGEQLVAVTAGPGIVTGKYHDKRLTLVTFWVEDGAGVNYQRKSDGFTALIGASIFGHIDIIDYLLEQGADVKLKNNNGMSALAMAIQAPSKNQLAVIKLLVEKGGANVNELVTIDTDHKTMLQFALSRNTDRTVIDYLKGKGATY